MIQQNRIAYLMREPYAPYPGPTRQFGLRAGRTDPLTPAHPAHPELPGQDLVAAGIADLARGGEAVAALPPSLRAPPLRAPRGPPPRGPPRVGPRGAPLPRAPPNAEHRLSELPRRDDPDAAHSRYNALVRRLV